VSTNASNVDVAVTGAVYATANGDTAAAPTTAVSALDVLFADLGYISDDGITESYNDDTSEIKAWQGGTIVRTIISGSKATLKFQMIENKREVVELYHKGSVVVSDGATGYKMDVMVPTPDRRSFVVDVIDGDDHERIYIADGEVSSRSDIVYKSDTQIGYEVEITMYPNNGVVCTKFSDKASWAPAA
jgi:hypothetical protein